MTEFATLNYFSTQWGNLEGEQKKTIRKYSFWGNWRIIRKKPKNMQLKLFTKEMKYVFYKFLGLLRGLWKKGARRPDNCNKKKIRKKLPSFLKKLSEILQRVKIIHSFTGIRKFFLRLYLFLPVEPGELLQELNLICNVQPWVIITELTTILSIIKWTSTAHLCLSEKLIKTVKPLKNRN